MQYTKTIMQEVRLVIVPETIRNIGKPYRDLITSIGYIKGLKEQGAKFKLIRNSNGAHAEANLVDELGKKLEDKGEKYSLDKEYIGIAKLSCAMCHMCVKEFNRVHGKDVGKRGMHGKMELWKEVDSDKIDLYQGYVDTFSELAKEINVIKDRVKELDSALSDKGLNLREKHDVLVKHIIPITASVGSIEEKMDRKGLSEMKGNQKFKAISSVSEGYRDVKFVVETEAEKINTEPNKSISDDKMKKVKRYVIFGGVVNGMKSKIGDALYSIAHPHVNDRPRSSLHRVKSMIVKVVTRMVHRIQKSKSDKDISHVEKLEDRRRMDRNRSKSFIFSK